MTTTNATSSPRLSVLAAFAAVYFIWGSTWLAMRFAVETLPVMLLESVRVLGAGSILFVWARLRGVPMPERGQLLPALIAGGLLFGGGEAITTWAVRFVPSGVGSVLFALTPLWMVLFNWLWTRTERPGGRVMVGVALGLVGIVLLVGPGQILGGEAESLNLFGVAILLVGAITFVNGSLYSRTANLPESPFMSTSVQMLTSGALLLVLSVATGEISRLNADTVTTRSVVSLAYLIVFGSVLAWSAYIFLLRETTPARAASYAYVNPVVAVVVGWAVGGEALTLRMLVASVIIIAGVVLIITRQTAPEAATQPELASETV